ncbi:hypothetical protein QQS21_008430 [Conoideocrella luteorostrata]|uniref:DNase1 protein n=1 Tax=Conoideocrella luteorostrata TaxID=1105319 RepID=A0AAJ0CL81_9HYPO|nr:hypothetical protein QQS21_008430 [Conoideocrella luteorostrata]
MQFAISTLALLASAAAVSASSVSFWTLDDATRTVYFTPSSGYDEIKSVTVDNKEKTKVEFPEKWIGNFYAVKKGEENKPGMLGEVNFNSWGGMTYFDVSAIVAPTDHDNVKQMWPANGESPMSGCLVFPCGNAYWLPDDIQTKVTSEHDLITTLGAGSTGIKFAEAQ